MAKIRKQVYNLTLEDLRQYPVWEYALDEECKPNQDECTVRPRTKATPFDPAEGLAIVRCDFRLADGTHAVGYLTPQVTDFTEIGYIRPTIVTPSTQVSFWFGIQKPDVARLREEYKFLEKDRSQVFPVRFESAVEITTGPLSGVIEGFLYYRSLSDRTVVAVS